jgi:DNA mismatch repair protein MutS2
MPDMNEHSLKVLDFEALKAKIAGFSAWEKGKAAILAIMPFNTLEPIQTRQTEVQEALNCLKTAGSPPLEGLKDVEDYLRRTAKGGILEGKEIWEVGELLGICARVKKYLTAHYDIAAQLAAQARALALYPELERNIKQRLTPEGKVQDNATVTLRDIRRRIVNLEQQIHQKLRSIMRSQAYKNMLQEPIFTFREGHFVLPIKQEYRSKFPGVLFDRSLSGATLFMEPLAIMEAGNNLREALAEQECEILKILKQLSLEIAGCCEELCSNLNLLARLDLTFALAGFALKYECILPPINTNNYLRLEAARHPLLTVKPIPIDIELGRDFTTVVLTGPNTGGKTVTLKTLGLFTLMGLSGIPLPAGNKTTIPLLKEIFADIGDEQSLTSNLSTFSAHITNIISFLPYVDERTLVLLDELGAGTDPVEGTALGIALLEYLHKRRTLVIASTHYGELKAFASRHKGAINAAMEFDVDTLQPTYKITLGVPGRSCALAVAQRLGLPEIILNHAKDLAFQQHQNLEELLEQLKATKEEAEAELEKSLHLKEEYELKLNELKLKEEEILETANLEARTLIRQTKEELEKLIKSAHHTLIAQPRIAKVKPDISKAASKFRSVLQELERTYAEAHSTSEMESWQIGDWVYVPALEEKGQIVAINKPNEIKVSIKGKKFSFKPAEIKLEERPLFLETETEAISLEKKMHISDSLNLRGMRVEEALSALEKYMDDALLANLSSFNIIHGKGEGILRKVVHEYLKASPAVKKYQLADYYEGGRGVTVVELK